ncbi:MAG TPA: hypothetical protein VF101_11050 [Gaiellaceae bacterium]
MRVLGEPAGSPPLRSRVAYVTQAPSGYRDLTVRENLRYFAAVVAAPAAEVDRVVVTVGLRRERDRVVGELSRGQRARLTRDGAARQAGGPRPR